MAWTWSWLLTWIEDELSYFLKRGRVVFFPEEGTSWLITGTGDELTFSLKREQIELLPAKGTSWLITWWEDELTYRQKEQVDWLKRGQVDYYLKRGRVDLLPQKGASWLLTWRREEGTNWLITWRGDELTRSVNKTARSWGISQGRAPCLRKKCFLAFLTLMFQKFFCAAGNYHVVQEQIIPSCKPHSPQLSMSSTKKVSPVSLQSFQLACRNNILLVKIYHVTCRGMWVGAKGWQLWQTRKAWKVISGLVEFMRQISGK